MQIAALNIDERYRRLRLDLDYRLSIRPTSAMIFTALDDARVRKPPHCVVARVGEAREPKIGLRHRGVRKAMLGFAR
jgi:hypothetical protein